MKWGVFFISLVALKCFVGAFAQLVRLNTTGKFQVITADAELLAKKAHELREQYKKAQPFPHIFIDDIFPTELLEAIASEIPEVPDGEGCLQSLGGIRCIQMSNAKNKSTLAVENDMKPVTRMMFGFLKSHIWLTFLESLSGIGNLISDPGFTGSGIHVTTSGGNLRVHADFNNYPQYKLQRRVNTFVYLNNNWQDEWGGHLELWNRELTECPVRLAPAFGRFVVFSTTDFSYHGHPEPLKTPPNRARRSLALYYYTNGGRPKSECVKGHCGYTHSTLYQNPKDTCVNMQAQNHRYYN
eukprot:CAMPEP_0174971086 /NCGR_PEP_ID=MMETSP0004_2-20121128/9780_1 /TAXON_ID=420556 /ORGANISM="Ochromonas sp., Strain CCMP1393" /LENGTH=297 /DNA_ID=CAMNT_0016220963 /DNA_START=13 /DNA_END=906 /DNA_ORIENTATION=-